MAWRHYKTTANEKWSFMKNGQWEASKARLIKNARRGARRRASRLAVYLYAPNSVCMKEGEGGRKPGKPVCIFMSDVECDLMLFDIDVMWKRGGGRMCDVLFIVNRCN